MMVLLLFFCSGATALIYEVIWSKYLTMLFGSTVQAQTVVLAVFMGGLALGNKLFGGRADRSREPLELYGRLEIIIGLYAIAFRWLYMGGDWLFIKLGHGRLDAGGWLFLIKAFLSVGLLLGPTILMGGTLPLLASWLQRRTSDASRASARFYAVNSLGAVFGSWLAGFYLVQHLGLVSGVEMTACANVLIGIAAIVLSRREGESEAPVPAKESTPANPLTKTSILSSGLLLVAVTGAVSMGLEVLSSRTLALIVGGSLQSFAIVLMAFILGIGIGGSIIASAGWKRISEATVTITLLLCAAGIVGSLVLGIEYWVAFYGAAKNGLASTAMGYRYHQVLTAAMAIVVLGLPAGMLGAVLPLWIRHLSGANQGLAGQVGRLLTWNTVGAVIGTLLTGFFLMPHLGLRGSYLALVLVLCGVAAWTAWAKESRAAAGVAGAIGLAFATLGLTTGEGWRDVLSSGMFRVRNYGMNFKEFKELRRSFKLVFYEDAPDATVSVEVGDGVRAKHQTTLRINGKADATTHGDLSTQYLLAHLPMLAKPDAKEIFVLGFGSGATAGALTGHPIKSLTIAENCEPVLRASVHFAELNRNVLSNALTHVRNEDARTVLKLNPTKFDVIISEPSNPWMAGVGSVFSKEFYQLAASKLNEGGVMAQWFHIYEMSDGIVSLVIRTFNQVFPNMEIWDSQMGDIILLGSKTPWPSNPDVYRQVFERAEPRKDLERIGLKSPELVWARQLASQRTAYALATQGPIQSDVFPVLEYQAPEAFFIGENASLLMLFDERSWQSELMPADKARGLAQLDDDGVKSVFGEYYSANADMGRYMAWRFMSDPAAVAANPMNDSRSFPCIFRPATNIAPHKLDIPKEADEELKQFLVAEHDLFTNTNQWQTAADRLIELTKTISLTKPDGKPRAWHTTFFVNNAARKALAHGDHARASKLLIAGLEKQPRSYQLLYLARILEREAEAGDKAKAAGK